MSFDEDLHEDHVAILVALPNRLGGAMCEIKVPVQELWLKIKWGLIHEGGRICGTQRYV